MRKRVLTLIIAVALLAQPLEALAWCCKAVLWSTLNLPLIDDYPSNKVVDVKSEEECLNTCEDWKDTAAFAVINFVGLTAVYVRSNYHCQNFYRKDAQTIVASGTCQSASTGCCQVKIDDEYLSFSANDVPGESPSECDHYCFDTLDCTAQFIPGSKPDGAGRCETPPVQIPTSTDPGFSVGDYQFTTPTDPLKYANYNPARVLAQVINGALLILGTIALLMFIYAGVLWMTDRGGGSNIKKARSILVWSTAGLVLIFISYIAVGYLLETLSAI